MASKWFLKNIYSGDVIEVTKPTFPIGRSRSVEIICYSKNVSREHGIFVIESGNLYVEDWNSSNGTYVNDKKIPDRIRFLLNNGDIVGIGLGSHGALVTDEEHKYVFEVLQRPEIIEPVDVVVDLVNILESEDESENKIEVNCQHNSEEGTSGIEICSDGVVNKIEAAGETVSSNVMLNIKQEDMQCESSNANVSLKNQRRSLVNGDVRMETNTDACNAKQTENFGPVNYLKVKTEKVDDSYEYVKPKGYSVEDDFIVINDEDDYEVSSSQLFTSVNADLDDDIYKKIKTELEELDAVNFNDKPIVIDDSDSENDWFGSDDILLHFQLELDTNVQSLANSEVQEEAALIPQITENNGNVPSIDENEPTKSERNRRSINSSNYSESKFMKPPIIEPVQQVVTRKSSRKQENSKMLKVSASSVQKRASGRVTQRKSSAKRKSEEKCLENTKRHKYGDTKNSTQRKRSTVGILDHIDNAEKLKIRELRKNKLRELENKHVDKTNSSLPSVTSHATTVLISKKANVKVSDGRGNFLLNMNNKTAAPMTKINVVKANSTDPRPGTSRNINSGTLRHGDKENIISEIQKNSIRAVSEANIKNDNKIYKPSTISCAGNAEIISSRYNRIQQNYNNKINNCAPAFPNNANNNVVSQSLMNCNNNTNNNLSPQSSMLSFDVILNILNWKTSWLEEQLNLKDPPPVNKRLPVKMCYSFTNHNDYCNIVNPLLILELWNSIFKEWCGAADVRMQQERRFSASIEAVLPQKNHIVLRCLSYITQRQKENRKHVKDHDIVLVNVPLLTDRNILIKKVFGFVLRCSRHLLHKNDFIENSLVKEVPGKPAHVLSMDIVIRSMPEQVSLEKYIEGGIITSLTSPLREFDAVKSLGNSPLCKFILDPKVEDYSVPQVSSNRIISKDNLCPVQQQTVLEATTVCLGDSPGIYLIQGPPGTGKTTVITSIVQNIIFNDKSKAACILLVAPSNTAVDSLVLKITKVLKPKLNASQKKEIKLLRIGPRHSIHDQVKPYSLDELIKSHVNRKFLVDFPEVKKDYHELNEKKIYLKLQIDEEKAKGHDTHTLQKSYEEVVFNQDNFAKNYLKQRYNAEYALATRTLLDGANIICTTLSSCVKLEEHHLSGKMSCCIVDEATQSRESETLIPLTLGIKRLVLVGDPQQLPAVTISQGAKELGHGQSLFARIKHHFDGKLMNPIRMLNLQFRMHPEISLFPNNNFYDGKLQNSPTYCPMEGLNKLQPYYLFSLNSKNNKKINYTNDDEVECVAKLLGAIKNTVGNNLEYSVGIITPYNVQKEALNRRFCQLGFNSDLVSVNTVDSFQGLEKDVIILSCVRYSPNNFLRDEQRLNVAITRAKHILYIVGTHSLFQQCATLNRIKKNAEERNLYVNINCSVNSSVLQAVISTK